MTKDDHGQALVYDAWNRLVRVLDSGGDFATSYAYDGTGKRIVENRVDTAAFAEVSPTSNFVLKDGELFFFAGDELWVTDSDIASAELVKDINTGTNSSTISTLALVNGVLFFAGDDGTSASLVADIAARSVNSSATLAVVITNCPERESNPHFHFWKQDFKSGAENAKPQQIQAFTITPAKSVENTQKSPQKKADTDDNSPTVTDPHIAALVRAWPTLPEAIRAAIKSMIQAVRQVD